LRRERDEIVFKSKKQKEAEARAKDKLSDYVERDLKRASPRKQSYQDKCGHCKGGGVIGGGKQCLNCGGGGTITRFR
jgi:DnaJ-class molecular chaperone